MKEKPSLDRWSLLEQAGTVLDEQFHHDAIYWHLVETAAYGRQLEAEITRLRTEGERLRLTDAEREAIQTAIDILTDPVCRSENKQTESLRALLARLGGGA